MKINIFIAILAVLGCHSPKVEIAPEAKNSSDEEWVLQQKGMDPLLDGKINILYEDTDPMNYSCQHASLRMVLDQLFARDARVAFANFPELDYASDIHLELKGVVVSVILQEAVKQEKTGKVRLVKSILR